MSDAPPYALVTGAGRGIGAAICQRLAADGFALVANYRSNHAAAEELAETIRDAGGQIELLPGDVADRALMRERLTALVAERGAPQAVVLNAGINRDGLLAFMRDEDWDEVVGTGLGGFYNILRPLIGDMLKARRGRIVSIASTTGQMGNPGQTNYAAAKGGLIAATKALAREIAKRSLTANVVAPGLIDTDMTKELPVERMLQAVPLGRMGTPAEVAACVGFLCAPEAGYVTGQVLAVNGGLYT